MTTRRQGEGVGMCGILGRALFLFCDALVSGGAGSVHGCTALCQHPPPNSPAFWLHTPQRSGAVSRNADVHHQRQALVTRHCSLVKPCFLCPHHTPPNPKQVAELATQMYITNDKPNVSGLVLSGSADFKTELSQSDMFDPRLQAVVLGVVDVSYGE